MVCNLQIMTLSLGLLPPFEVQRKSISVLLYFALFLFILINNKQCLSLVTGIKLIKTFMLIKYVC